MPQQPDPNNPAAQSDPHDPLSPRPDDPRIGRWWWARRLYRRSEGRPRLFGRPATIVWMTLLIGLVALGVVLFVSIL